MDREQQISISCGDLALEGRLATMDPTSAAVITHPHPLYGGDMHNAVVETISRAYRNNGWSTLRFNFRGTGKSRGRFEDGEGEQDDVTAAVAMLNKMGFKAVELAGYSFGAWVLNCRARQPGGKALPMRFVAPPVGFIDFSPISPLASLQQVVLGTDDEFSPLEQCKAMVPQWNPGAELNVVDGADHFFWNHMDKLRKILENSIPEKNF